MFGLHERERPTWLPSTPHFKPQDFRPNIMHVETFNFFDLILLPMHQLGVEGIGAPIGRDPILVGGADPTQQEGLWPPFLLAWG